MVNKSGHDIRFKFLDELSTTAKKSTNKAITHILIKKCLFYSKRAENSKNIEENIHNFIDL